MAVNNANVLVGACTPYLSAWVSAGGAGSFTDLGHTKGPVVIGGTRENFEAKSERAFGPIKIVPVDGGIDITIQALEMTSEMLRTAFGQPSANRTTATTGDTLRIGQPAEQYHQVKLEHAGLGTTGTRTWTFWKCIVADFPTISVAKGDTQVVELKLRAVYDSTVTTADNFGKWVDS